MAIPRIATYAMPGSQDLPENRVGWQADASRAALLIHDMQDYFLDFYDPSAAPVPALLAAVLRLRQACDALGMPVFYTAQPAVQPPEDRALLTEFWGPGLPAKPDLAGIHASLAPAPHHVVLDKWRYSAFVRSDLEQQLKAAGRNQLIVCGIYAHIGCQVTCVDAFMRDIQPILVADAVADFSAAQHAQALDYVSRRAGVVWSSDQVLAQLGFALPASLDAMTGEVAGLLDLPAAALAPDDNLLDAGLDSIRIMSLLERWKRAGARLSFVELAGQPTLASWWALMPGGGR